MDRSGAILGLTISVFGMLCFVLFVQEDINAILSCPACRTAPRKSLLCIVILAGVAYIAARGVISLGELIRWLVRNWHVSADAPSDPKANGVARFVSAIASNQPLPAFDAALRRLSKRHRIEFRELNVIMAFSIVLFWYLHKHGVCLQRLSSSTPCVPPVGSLLAPFLAIAVSFSTRWGPLYKRQLLEQGRLT